MNHHSSFIEEESFVNKSKTKVTENIQLTDVLDCIKLGKINVGGTGRMSDIPSPLEGKYVRYQRSHQGDHNFGVMNNWYSIRTFLTTRYKMTVVIQALDGLGSTWTVSAHSGLNDMYRYGRDQAETVPLYKWHKGKNIRSILPPKTGWIDNGASEFFRRADALVELNEQNRVVEVVEAVGNQVDSEGSENRWSISIYYDFNRN